jgi:hypothetical protein
VTHSPKRSGLTFGVRCTGHLTERGTAPAPTAAGGKGISGGRHTGALVDVVYGMVKLGDDGSPWRFSFGLGIENITVSLSGVGHRVGRPHTRAQQSRTGRVITVGERVDRAAQGLGWDDLATPHRFIVIGGTIQSPWGALQ